MRPLVLATAVLVVLVPVSVDARPEYLEMGSARYIEGVTRCERCRTIGSLRICMRALADDYASLGWYRGIEECLALDDVDEAIECIRSKGMPYADNCAACHPGETFDYDVLFPDHKAIGCKGCHAVSRPPSHGEDFTLAHGPAALERANVCAVCHDREFCNQCHADMVPAFHKAKGYDHGADAKRDPALCRLCHDEKAFCVQCHEAGDPKVFGLRGPTPHPKDHHDAPNCGACHDSAVYTDFGLGSPEIEFAPDPAAAEILPQAMWSRAENQAKWEIMWWMFGIGVAIFLVGMFSHIVVWLQGGKAGEGEPFDNRAAWKAVWQDAILQSDTFRRDKLRWWAYAGIHFGFYGMLIGFLIVVFVRHIFHPMVFADSTSWSWAVSKGVTPWAGFVLDLFIDLFGIFTFVGIVLAMGRRWVWPSPLPPHEAEDMLSLFLLFAVIVTGFAVEATKLAPLVPEAAQWATFAPTAAARVMGRFEVSWTGVHYYLWLIHLAVTFVFLAWFPFGKLFHAVTSPISVAIEAGREKGQHARES